MSKCAVCANMIQRDSVKVRGEPQAVPSGSGRMVELPRCRPDVAEEVRWNNSVRYARQVFRHHDLLHGIVGHFFLEMIGGTCSPFFGLTEFPIEYPTMDPSIPVPADWSILPTLIKIVMHTMATRMINNFGWLVNVISSPFRCLLPTGLRSAKKIGSPSPFHY